MEGLVGTIVILAVFVYFWKKGSESASKTKTTPKIYPQSPSTDIFPNLSPPTPKTDPYANPLSSGEKSYSTTGDFTRSTEGYIPTDKCDCGGQWVKHVNKTTGGRFFGCSRYPSCDNTRDKQQVKNFCSNGHARTSQNTGYNTDGSRRCLICRPISNQSISSSIPSTKSKKPSIQQSAHDTNLYCKNGHKRTTKNTYVRPNGQRECGICRKNARR
jgi:hypothetical protein